MIILTKNQILDIALGYKWNPEMDFDEFSKHNSNIPLSKKWEIFTLIEQRYLEKVYENK